MLLVPLLPRALATWRSRRPLLSVLAEPRSLYAVRVCADALWSDELTGVPGHPSQAMRCSKDYMFRRDLTVEYLMLLATKAEAASQVAANAVALPHKFNAYVNERVRMPITLQCLQHILFGDPTVLPHPAPPPDPAALEWVPSNGGGHSWDNFMRIVKTNNNGFANGNSRLFSLM